MVEASLYFIVYIAICWILVFTKILQSSSLPQGILTPKYGKEQFIKCLIIIAFFILFFGLRPIDDLRGYMADTYGYAQDYEALQMGDPFAWTENPESKASKDFLFSTIMSYMASIGASVHLWLIVVAAIFLLPLVIVIKHWFPHNLSLSLLFTITYFGFYSGGINGIRNADAISLFLLGMIFLSAKKLSLKGIVLGAVLCYCAYYFHQSSVILIFSLLMSLFIVKNVKFAIIIWCAAIVFALTMGNTLAELSSIYFPDDRAEKYLMYGMENEVTQAFSHTGFRWDFLLYSTMPLLMGWYVLVKKGIRDHTYLIIVNTYILANACWIIFMYAAFTNRFAALSWGLYPYVILYPLVRYNIWGKKQAVYTSYILVLQLVFTSLFA